MTGLLAFFMAVGLTAQPFDSSSPLAVIQQSMPVPIELSISGTDGVTFEGRCTFITGSGRVDVQLAGVVPERHAREGTGLSCEIRKTRAPGMLVVEVSKAGRVVSRNVSGGGRALLSISIQ